MAILSASEGNTKRYIRESVLRQDEIKHTGLANNSR